MRFITLALSSLAFSSAASIGAKVGGLDLPEAVSKQKDLHPTNFPNIQAAHTFHDLIRELYPYVENAADLAGIEMKDLLDGTPFDWDAHFANSTTTLGRRSYLEAGSLMSDVSRVLLTFIARFAGNSKHPLISNLAETLADYLA